MEEPHDTYAENATAKAVAYGRASDLLTLADDSGIEVAALGWGPGVRSARWRTGAGSQAAQLVEAMHGQVDRRARMVCALAVAVPAGPEPSVEIFNGVVDGSVATEPRGGRRLRLRPDLPAAGAGARPRSCAEPEKDRISHRGWAVAAALAATARAAGVRLAHRSRSVGNHRRVVPRVGGSLRLRQSRELEPVGNRPTQPHRSRHSVSRALSTVLALIVLVGLATPVAAD